MRIQIKKLNKIESEYTITRNDNSVEKIVLDTKTYFIHDICHFVVEKNLGYTKGFWGMLAQGYSFKELLGKENALTEELRFIEKIVGPIQAVYSGYYPKENLNIHIAHLNFEVSSTVLENSLKDIKTISEKWEKLIFGESLELQW
jgi:hypothetical protein